MRILLCLVVMSSVYAEQLILGISTGRSGSTTLTALLRKQKGCYATHESSPVVNWIGGEAEVILHIRKFRKQFKEYPYVCDVSHWWLRYLDQMIKEYPNLRVVALRRSKSATVQSFLRCVGGDQKGGLNLWSFHDSSYYQTNSWAKTFPRNHAKTMTRALENYWEEYHAGIDQALLKYPNHIKSFHVTDLNSVEKQKELLEFCGFREPKIDVHLHYNHKKIGEGAQFLK